MIVLQPIPVKPPPSILGVDIYTILFSVGFIAFCVWLAYRYMAYQQRERAREAQFATMLAPDELKALANDPRKDAPKKTPKKEPVGVKVEIDPIDSILDDEEEERRHREAVLKRRRAQQQRGSTPNNKPKSRNGSTSRPPRRKPVKRDRSESERPPARRKPRQD